MRISLLSSDLVTSEGPSHTLREVEPWEIEQDKILHAIRSALKRAGLTQAAVEVRLEMGRGYVSQLLTGAVEIKLKHILQICEIIGASGKVKASAREILYEALDRHEVEAFYQKRAARQAELASHGPSSHPALAGDEGEHRDVDEVDGGVRYPDTADETATATLFERSASPVLMAEVREALQGLLDRAERGDIAKADRARIDKLEGRVSALEGIVGKTVRKG
jgi:transcriptional regulator with XRE-family HTH domain